jgi:hypothetical protein
VNSILKKFLGIGEQVAMAMIPGAGPVDVAARNIITAADGGDKADAIFATGVAALQLIETDFGVKFANEPDFQAGLGMAKAGFTLMTKAIKTYNPPVPSPAV